MKITTFAQFQMTAVVGEYLPVCEEFYEYDGPVEKACFGGASQQEKNISGQQAQFYQTLQNNYAQQFKGQTAILNQLQSAYAPILAAGPGQFGFTPAEAAAMRTQADEGTAAAYQHAKQAVGEQLAARGGGNFFLPSGTEAGIYSDIATRAAAQQSSEQLGITEAGYQQGLANFNQAARILGGPGGVSEQLNPLGYAGSATSAGHESFKSANIINQEELAAQQAKMSLIGGAASAVLGGFTGGFGNLDSTGGSSGGEQGKNFLSGFLGGI